MSLKLMYITKDSEVAKIAEQAGVDRIFVDMEYIGKADRQGGMDTVQSFHTAKDVKAVKAALTTSELIVRVNPIHDAGSYKGIPHVSSKEEIEAVIEAGADIVMLPFFKTIEEVDTFLSVVDNRCKTMLLVETEAAAELLPILKDYEGIDYIHIGLNDLSLEQGKTFMFEILADGTVERLCDILKNGKAVYGFGGIAAPGSGLLPAEYIIRDHYWYGSSCVILSRSFCNTTVITDLDEIRAIFEKGVADVRRVEEECKSFTEEQFAENHKEVINGTQKIVDVILAKRKR